MTAVGTGPVAVIGGGVIGLAAAHSLRRRGVDVVVVEQGRVGSGASHGNAGWIVPSLSAPLAAPGMLRTALTALTHRHGPLRLPPRSLPAMLPWLLRFWSHCTSAEHLAALRATAVLGADAMQLYDDLADDGVDFEMGRAGLLTVLSDAGLARRAVESLRPLAEFGYGAAELLDEAALRELEPALGPAARAGFLVPQERAVDPAGLIAGLARRLGEMGVPIHEDWPVHGFGVHDSRVTSIHGPAGDLTVGAVVVAGGARSTELLRHLGVRLHMKPGKGYSLTVRADRRPSRPVYLAEAKVGVTPMGPAMRVAGLMEFAGFDERAHRRRLATLAAAAKPYLRPWSADAESDHWCGFRPVTPDGLPVIARVPTSTNAYVATGHAMLGVTLAPSTGQAVAELVLGDASAARLHPFRLDRPGLAGRCRTTARPARPATDRDRRLA